MVNKCLTPIVIRLLRFGDKSDQIIVYPYVFEFHISKASRDYYHFDKGIFSTTGNIILVNLQAVKALADKINKKRRPKGFPLIRPGHLNAMGLIDEILHYVVGRYHKEKNPAAFKFAIDYLNQKFGPAYVEKAIVNFTELFPPLKVYLGKQSVTAYLRTKTKGRSNFLISLEEMLLLYLANENPAFAPFRELFDDKIFEQATSYRVMMAALNDYFRNQPFYGPYNQPLIDLLKAPVVAAPNSLTGQLLYIKDHWGLLLSSELFDRLLTRILVSLDFIKEEERPKFMGPGPALVPVFMPETEFYQEFYQEEEKFTQDSDWMPRVVMIVKHTYVWLHQLSKKYDRPITKLNEIPDEELDTLAQWGFTALWLIGVWQRSKTSQKIKQLCGNPEALPSAYAVYDYKIAEELGGENAYHDLKERALKKNIRIAVDIVPNHTGIYSNWIVEHPDWFTQSDHAPFSSYKFTGPDLSEDHRISIYLEDGYWNRTDAAVVFKLVEHPSNRTRYIFHGNDGTSTPWNDTAQLNFLLPAVREAVLKEILKVARKSSIIRLDAAMTLTKKHYQRLWFPEPGKGGDIASRTECSMSRSQFNKLFPKEFWREVVDRISQEVPHTLLLAEAFWLMEGYFVRSLGMHRVYNSAFMNMLKMEENRNYRSVIKNVLDFDPEILRRFVNFMNNPDELPAIVQFGNGDKYFGVALMMVTMPGLAMFGHGQIEGFSEKYGMEYKRAYQNESIDENMVQRHESDIFPFLKKRYLFSGVENFLLYDFYEANGQVNEDVFAYSNGFGKERVLILYNNRNQEARGWIRLSASFSYQGRRTRKSLAQGLGMNSQDEYYYIFRDYHSRLQYIRSGKELAENGLYVELGAHKYHVFMDLQEIRDNDADDYMKLTKFLDGQGVFDIPKAIKEMKLTPVLDHFRAIIDVKMLYKMASYENIHLFEKKIHHLARAIKIFLGAKTDESVVSDYLLGFLKIILVDFTNMLDHPSKTIKPAIDFIKTQRLKDKQEVLFIWLVVHTLGKIINPDQYEQQSAFWLEEWFFTKIIEETFIKLGEDNTQAQRHALLIKILSGLQYLFDESAKTNEKMRILLNDNDVKNYLRLNWFKGVLWFNKESYENLLSWLFMISAIKTTRNHLNDKKKMSLRIRNRYRLVKKLLSLASKAGYRFEELMSKLEGTTTIS